jgi:hypothetical protein
LIELEEVIAYGKGCFGSRLGVYSCGELQQRQHVAGITMSNSSFPIPTSISAVPGAENWQSMYAYFTRVKADDDKRFWFYNSMHFSEPMQSPFTK